MSGMTLEALAEAVSEELASRGLDAQPDGRVAAAPDARTIRYYTTLGLLDRPTLDDKKARYGRRHLLQLLAIKALQAAQLPLAQIQARLYGLRDAELEALWRSVEERPRGGDAPTPIVWREVTVEPGLKILADARWAPGGDPARLADRIRAALGALVEERTQPTAKERSNR